MTGHRVDRIQVTVLARRPRAGAGEDRGRLMIATVLASVQIGAWGVVAAMVISLYLSAFFSGSETGIMSVSRVRLRHGGVGGPRRARLLALLDRLEDPILTCLIGTNLFNVIASAIMTARS